MSHRSISISLVMALTVAACDTTEPVIEDQPVELSASAEVRSDTVFYQLNATNVADTVAYLSWAGCIPEIGAVLSVHGPASGSSSLRWSEVEWRREDACYTYLAGTTIPPGESRPLARRVAVRDILGDSLPGGQYRLFVTPAFLNEIPSRAVDTGVVTLAR